MGAHRSTFRRQMDKTVAQKQSRVPAAHASQQSSDSSFHLEKGLKKAKITPKCILGTRKWPIFGRFRPFPAPQTFQQGKWHQNEHFFFQRSVFTGSSLWVRFEIHLNFGGPQLRNPPPFFCLHFFDFKDFRPFVSRVEISKVKRFLMIPHVES